MFLSSIFLSLSLFYFYFLERIDQASRVYYDLNRVGLKQNLSARPRRD